MTDQKPWLEQYPESIPHEIDLDQYQSIVDMAEQAFSRFSDRVAYVNFGATMTYGELDARSRAFGAYLQSLGLQKGDRVAVMMPNLLQYPVAIFGILRAGLTVVNTNPLYTARELRHQLNDSGARAILVAENFAATVAEVIDGSPIEQVIITSLGDLVGFPKGTIMNFVIKHVRKMVPRYELPQARRFNDVLRAGSRLTLQTPGLDHRDLAFLQYTGGTTGVSKGAMLSHGNMVANMLQAMTWLSTRFAGDHQNLTVVTAIPLYHIFALTANCLVFMLMGGRNLLITNPRDMPGFVKELSSMEFNAITGVNTLFNGLLNTPGFSDLDFSSLKLTLGGGMAVQRAVAERWKQVTGIPLIEAYGLTETAPAACINPMDLQDYNGSIGLPIPSTECRVCDSDGNPLPTDEVGELCIRGPQVMQGYWMRPEETGKVLSEDGWLRTGDMARMDEKGYFYIVDRKKDMILVSGFNVYPNEVEDVAATHPGVLEVGAIGVPDDKSGEVVKLVVVRKDESLSVAELREYCKKELTGYKVPRYIQFVDELPKTNVGKILRRELRELFGKPEN